MNFLVCSLSLLALLALVQCQSQSFQGTWLDNRGYTLSLCVTNGGTFLQGSYQQFGIIQANISDNGTYARGRWYEARNPLSTCANGGLTFRLVGDNHFDGNYDCSDQHDKGQPYVWNGDRFSPDIEPTYIDCAVLTPKKSANVAGGWIVDPSIVTFWDICTQTSTQKYTSSYECDPELDCFGYEQGFIYEDGKILQGQFTNDYPDSNSVDGSALVALLNDTHLIHYQWATPITTARVISYSQHVTEFNITYSNTSDSTLCNRNQDIYDQLYYHFSPSSLPAGDSIISNVQTASQNYHQPSNESVHHEYSSSSSTLRICFVLATIILLLI